MTKIEKVVFWCDSTIVLHWIHQANSNYKAFAGNRVSEIHIIKGDLEATLEAGMVSWRYVPSEYNLLMTSLEDYALQSLTWATAITTDPSFCMNPQNCDQKTKLTRH